jgi:Uma2 family endonuclease
MATDVHASEKFATHELVHETTKLYEVVDGEVVENPSMGARESNLANDLSFLMESFARVHQLGRTVVEVLFLLGPNRSLKRRPDLAFVSIRRWPLKRPIPPTECWEVIPDLAVEFIRETSSAASVDEKIDEYFEAGVNAVWIIYPETRKVYVWESPIQVRVLRVGDELDGGAIVPGFRIAVSELFNPGTDGSETAS